MDGGRQSGAGGGDEVGEQRSDGGAMAERDGRRGAVPDPGVRRRRSPAVPVLSPAQARAVYDRVGASQDRQGWYEDTAVDRAVAHGAFGTARSVVEVGCGTGRLAARLLAHELPPVAQLTASDPSPVMAGLARQRLAPWAGRATVVEAFGVPPVAAGAVDRVVATYVLDLLSDADARRLVADAHRALAPGGRLVLAGLSAGVGPLSRAVAAGWRTVWHVRPAWVGGCRPVEAGPLLDGGRWETVHHGRVAPWGVPSESLVAVRRVG